jgi:hypothetical protein
MRWTFVLTVLAGTLVVVFGQIMTRFMIEPLYEQARLRRDIAYSLVFYGRECTNPQTVREEKYREAEDAFRALACRLPTTMDAIPLYWIWAVIRLVPRYEDVMKAGNRLIWLSNSLARDDAVADQNIACRREIRTLLRIRQSE